MATLRVNRERVQLMLDAKGWTDTQLAQESNLRLNTIRNNVHGGGNARLSTVAAIASALGLPAKDILEEVTA